MNQVAGQVGPRDSLERSMRAIWADVLGHRHFGVQDNFFAVGGDSFKMVLVQAKVAATFNYEIPLATLLSAPSIAGAAVLLRGDTTRESTALVPLTSGAGVPVFCFHPLGGSAAIYYPLAQALPGRACYGLQALGLTLGHPPQTSLGDMVGTYVDAVLSVQPEGPHHFVGYSLGGLVAVAAGQELQRRGAGPSVIFVLGTPTWLGADEREPYLAVGAYAMHLDLDYDELVALGRTRALAVIHAQAVRQGVVGLDFPIERLAAIFDTSFANLHAVATAPPPRHDGRLVLIHSATETDGLDWAPYAKELISYPVPFIHAIMLEEKAARRIAPLIAQHLPS